MRQRLDGVVKVTINISIHAPARGATTLDGCGYPLYLISIHAPARGATLTLVDGKIVDLISIHAPARGATGVWHGKSSTESDFNPRTREGCDIASQSVGRRNG